MTVVRYRNRPAGHSFNNSLNDFFPGFASLYGEDSRNSIPVNIFEQENGYAIEIIAPGIAKEDIKISIEENILTVEAGKKEVKEEGMKAVKREYGYPAFKRSFTLNDQVDADNITAQYVNGVLTLNLAKKAEVKPLVKNISIQ